MRSKQQRAFDESDIESDKWESGALGTSSAHIVSSTKEESASVDKALGLQSISIRLQQSLIDELKEIALEEGIGYQPLVRQVLTKFVRSRRA